MKILNSIIVTLVLLSSAQVLAALNSNSNTDRILVTGDAKDNKARMGLGLPKNANLQVEPKNKAICIPGKIRGLLFNFCIKPYYLKHQILLFLETYSYP
jgi:hypothetical protein